ncbi:MAG: hypothetical protein ABI426_10860 [Flavobacterium sp.]
MDNNIRKLSDEQLISLLKSNGIDPSLKKEIISEIDRRDMVIKEVVQKELSLKKKCIIIFTSPFFYGYHVKESAEILCLGNKKGYKQYWTFFTFGIALYFFLLLIVAKYIIKP